MPEQGRTDTAAAMIEPRLDRTSQDVGIVVVFGIDAELHGSRQRPTGAALRDVLGDRALRIDHIGSNSVAGLAAKDVIDIQVTVASLAEASAWPEKLLPGLLRKPNASDHLPFRDYLRSDPVAAGAYEAFKRALALHAPDDWDTYYAVKDPACDLIWAGAGTQGETRRLAARGPRHLTVDMSSSHPQRTAVVSV